MPRPQSRRAAAHPAARKPAPAAATQALILERAGSEKPLLPITQPDFIKCSVAINQLTAKPGKPMLLPSELLPPPL